MQCSDALLFVAAKSHQEAQHFVKRRQTAHDVIVRTLHQARIVIVGIELRHPVAHLARRGRIVQRLPPGFAHQKIPVAAQSVRHPECVERLRVIRIRFQARLRQAHRFSDFIEEALFNFRSRIDLGTPHEGVVPGDQLAFQSPHLKHLPKLDALREVVVHGDRVRIRGLSLFKLRDGLIVFQVVEVIEGGIVRSPGSLLSERSQRGEKSDSDEPHLISV